MNHDDVIARPARPRIQPLGWVIICAVVALTLGVAVVAFFTSYGALYAWVRDADLYSDELDHIWPLLLDAAFVAAELAAILAAMLRGRPSGWPLSVMVITGILTIFFNIAHAGTHWTDWPKWLAASLPPILMMLMFQIDLAIVAWVRRALGRTEQMFGGAGSLLGVPQMEPQQQMGTWGPSANGQNGQLWGSGGAVTKRAKVEAYLNAIGHQRARELGPGRVTADLKEEGLEVTERHVRDIMGALPSTNGKGHA